MVIDEIRSMTLQAVSIEMPTTEKTASQAVRNETASMQQEEMEAAKIQVSRESLQEAVNSLNSAVSLLNHRLTFKIDDSTGRLTARVIDNSTNEVIREIPPERVLVFVKRFQEFLGLLMDEQA